MIAGNINSVAASPHFRAQHAQHPKQVFELPYSPALSCGQGSEAGAFPSPLRAVTVEGRHVDATVRACLSMDPFPVQSPKKFYEAFP